MGRCPANRLEDAKDVLDEIRKLEGLKEPKTGIFYFKGQGFLHFHLDKEENRWADIRDGEAWGAPVDLPFSASKKTQKDFIAETKRRFAKALK